MRARSDLERLARYHSWSRSKLLDLYATLPWKVLVRNREATFGSIRNVHLHILQVYAGWLVWMFRRRSLKPLLPSLDPKQFHRVTSVRQLRRLDRLIDEQFLDVCRRTGPGRQRRKTWFADGKVRSAFTEEEGLWHMIEEDFLHRGEIICMLWQDDIPPPNTSYMRWEYESDPTEYGYLPYHDAATTPVASRKRTPARSRKPRSTARTTAET